MDANTIERMTRQIIEEYQRDKGSSPSSCCKSDEGGCSCKNGKGYDEKLASIIEHSMIRPDATPAMVEQFCDEAVKYGFVNVSLSPCYVSMASQLLKGTKVKVATAIDFPLGAATTTIKVAETREVIENGATEIDLPINIGLLKCGDYKWVKNDIDAVAAAAGGRAVIKTVVDLGNLTDEEKIKAVLIAKFSGITCLKVAAGGKPGGVTPEDISFLRKVAGPGMGLKADGGIKDYKTAISVVEAGATRIGASGSVKIVTGP